MSEAVSIAAVNRTLKAVLGSEGRQIQLHDRATGNNIAIDLAAASAPDGLLPAMMVAAEAIWREATGQGFYLTIRRDASALLGYRLEGIGSGSFTSVMLCLLEAKAQAEHPDAVVVNDLATIWHSVAARLDQRNNHEPAAATRWGAAP